MSRREDLRNRVLGGIINRETPATPATAPAPKARPSTFIGQVGQQMTAGFAVRVEELEREREGGLVLLRLDPKQIGHSAFANRDARGLTDTDEAFVSLKASIQAHGQDNPVRVRHAEPGAALPFELVEGHRRHAACLALDASTPGGFTILARLDAQAKDTRDLVLKMYRENAERLDLSPYETGLMFASWLDAGVFGMQAELAEAVGRGAPLVSRYLALAQLPAAIIAAFVDPREISLRWAPDLVRVAKAAPDRVQAAAAKLAGAKVRLPADQIYAALLAAAAERRKPSPSREEAVVKIKGKVAFRFSFRDGKLALKFGREVDAAVQAEITEAIKELAERELTRRLKGSDT